MRRALLVLVVLALAYLVWVHEGRAPVRSPLAPPRSLSIAPGMSTDAIGRELHACGAVRHPLIFRAYVAWRGVEGRLRAGEYRLEGPLSLEQIIDLLVRGAVVRRELTFPEGKNIEEMAAIAETAGIDPGAFLAAARDAKPMQALDPEAEDLEGYLFPDTYDLPGGPGAAAALVERMVWRFRQVMAPELPLMSERGLTLRELTTLASLVELETGQADERPRIAAVFLNRLHRGMLLQTDPTIIYALRRAGRWDGNIRKQDLMIDSPYNTYRYSGLPPGPIASPGRDSLRAVLEPAPVKDLYFVSRNDGSHHFSTTLAEHERAVDRYQRRRRSRKNSGS